MFNQSKWQLLQLFSGEGGASGASAAGDGGNAADAATVVNSADDGHQRLREMGVPENRIRKPRAKQASALPEGAFRTEPRQAQQPSQAAAAEPTSTQTEGTKPTETPVRLSWEEIMKDPEYNAEMQKIIRSRVKDEGQNKATLETLSPMLKHLAKEKGLDPENIDHTALVNAVTGVYANRALELGVTEDTAMLLDQQQRTLDQQKFQNHMMRLDQQANALKNIVPNFDLRAEMQNPMFARLTSPGVDLSVEDAFYAVHRKEMQQQSMQVAAQQTKQMISNAIQSGSHRPDETGTAAQAPSVSKFDYRNATPAQRKAIKDEIRRAAAEGRKLYPG